MTSPTPKIKRPGGAPTPAEPVSEANPLKGKLMNSQEHITAAKDPLAPCGSLGINIDMAALREMDMEGVTHLRAAVHVLAEVACGLICQPRFGPDDDRLSYNRAGNRLSELLEWLNAYEQALANVAVASKPTSSRESEYRAWTIIGFQAELTDDLPELAVIASQAVRDVQLAKFRESHPRRDYFEKEGWPA